MTRLRADILLLFVAIVWGSAFVAQKTGMAGLGPFGFVGLRFGLSALAILLFVWREHHRGPPLPPGQRGILLLFSLIFFVSAALQQIGIQTTSVTNAGFLSGLYVIVTPFVAWGLFRRPPGWLIWPACVLALLGVWFLNNGAPLNAFHTGDWIVLASTFGFAFHVTMLGWLAQRTQRPLALVFSQNLACFLFGLPIAFIHEGGFTLAALHTALIPILYAGLVSGGIAYTVQAIAQQHTPPADAAIILAAESLFAALFGAWLMHDHLSLLGWAGCGLILLALGLVEAGGLLGPNFLASRRGHGS